jgi:hypothetical protein
MGEWSWPLISSVYKSLQGKVPVEVRRSKQDQVRSTGGISQVLIKYGQNDQDPGMTKVERYYPPSSLAWSSCQDMHDVDVDGDVDEIWRCAASHERVRSIREPTYLAVVDSPSLSSAPRLLVHRTWPLSLGSGLAFAISVVGHDA